MATGKHYTVPIHLQQSFKRLGYRGDDYPEAKRSASEVLSLPLFPEMTEEQAEAVVKAVLGCTRGVVGRE